MCSDLFKTRWNVLKCVQTRSKLVQMCSNLFKTCSKLVQMCSNVLKCVQMCSNVFKCVHKAFRHISTHWRTVNTFEHIWTHLNTFQHISGAVPALWSNQGPARKGTKAYEAGTRRNFLSNGHFSPSSALAGFVTTTGSRCEGACFRWLDSTLPI